MSRHAPIPDGRTPDVALLLRDFRGGGAERSMVNIANGLARQGLVVDLVVLETDGPFRKFLDATVRIIRLGGPRKGPLVGLTVPRFWHYLRQRRPTKIISTLEALTIIAFVGCRLAGCADRLVVRVATTFGCEPRPRLRRWLIRAVYRRHRGLFVTNSKGSRRNLLKHFEIAEERVHVIPNGIDLERVEALSQELPDPPLAVASAGPLILFVGRLSPQKGVDLAIRAFARVARELEGRLAMVGDGPERALAENLTQDLALGDRVQFLGFASNPFAYMSRADVLLFSSDYEGMPSVLIEALACGLPIVATDCTSGPAEILDQGRWGALVPVGDEAALAAAILRTLEAPIDRARLRKRAEAFSLEVMAESYRVLVG